MNLCYTFVTLHRQSKLSFKIGTEEWIHNVIGVLKARISMDKVQQ